MFVNLLHVEKKDREPFDTFSTILRHLVRGCDFEKKEAELMKAQ